jgi:hypothetical protein
MHTGGRSIAMLELRSRAACGAGLLTSGSTLRDAVAPYELPTEVVALLRWADGQDASAPWWPALESGRLLGAAEAAAHDKWLRDEADEQGRSLSSLLHPLAHEGWCQVGMELLSEGPGAIIDYGFGDQPRVLAPTLAVMLDVTAQMIEAGIASPRQEEDARVWRAKRAALLENRPEWEHWSHDRVLTMTGEHWPSHWRAALSD